MMDITLDNLNKAIADIHAAKRDVRAFKKSLDVFNMLSTQLKQERNAIIASRSSFSENLVSSILDRENEPHGNLINLASESIVDAIDLERVLEKIDTQISETQKARAHINELMRKRNHQLGNFRDVILYAILADLEENAKHTDQLHNLVDQIVELGQYVLDTDLMRNALTWRLI